MRFPVGITSVTFTDASIERRAERARDLGFDFIDVPDDVDPASLALPVGCTVVMTPRPGWCWSPALPEGPGRWEKNVARFRAAPGAMVEPYAKATVNSREKIEALQAEIPGIRFLIDTGHVADWGEDPVDLVEFADHIQLRQGAPGRAQLHVDDPDGVVDFAAVLARLDALDYQGGLAVEYFDLPEHGWPLEDPIGWSVDLAARVRSLMD